MKQALRTSPFILAILFCVGIMLRGLGTQIPSGSWAPSGNMLEGRSGASSVLLEDGRVLVAGGTGSSGPLTSVELYTSAGAFAPAAPMNTARSQHASLRLKNGRVLVAGGVTSGAGITNAAELFDPSSNQWIVIGAMSEARAGHTITLLQDGRALIVGGENSSGISNTLEFFDPETNSFIMAGVLASPRKEHATALLADGTVLIAGGASGAAALATTEIFDASTGSISAGPNLSSPRAGLTATTLLDGKVLLVGGSNGNHDLTSADLFDPLTYSVSASGSLAAARRNHQAFLLPDNNSVLLSGGTSGGLAVPTAELFDPWNSTFNATGTPLTARQQATGISLSREGLLLIAGGSNGSEKLSSSELYGFATIKTDRDDYAPGETVTMTGTGWEPGETVSLVLHEVNNPDPHEDRVLSAVADSWGRILNTAFAPEEHDLGIRFYLIATGAKSKAQMTFTDSVTNVTITAPTTATPITVTSLPANVTISFDYNTSLTGTTSGQADVLTVASASKSLTPGIGKSDSIVVTIPAGTANGSYNAKVTVTNTTGTGANNKNDVTNNSIIVSVPAIAPTTLAIANASGVYGGTTTLSATLTKTSDSSAVSGKTISFTLNGNAAGSAVTNASGVATLAGASLVGINANTYATGVAASFAGDASFTASNGTAQLMVGKANTSTVVSSTANPSIYGQSLTFTATVDPVAPGAGTRTGTVTFKDGATVLGTGTVNASGQATLSTASLSVDSHSITAEYSGDSNFNGSASPAFNQTVSRASTTTSVASSLNPSVYGQSVTFTATVTVVAPGVGIPTGNVEFFVGATSLGAGALAGTTATLTTSALTASGSPHSITAKYLGDGNFNDSTSSALSQTVNKADTTISLTSSVNPSVFGQSVTFTATVNVVAPGLGIPTGSVEFFDGVASLGLGSLAGTTATLTTSALTVSGSTHSITAKYLGDGNFNDSTSSPLTHTVMKASTSTSVTSSLNPSVYGQSVTFTASLSVVAPGAGIPTGNVEFFDGATSLGTGVLAGTATLTTSALTASGSPHTITAKYLGDGNFNDSTSAALSQAVNKADTTTSLTSSVNPSVFGQSVTFTATVNPVAPGAGTRTGMVTFKDGAAILGTGTLNASGQATFSTAALSVSSHSITAEYEGDGNFNGSASSILSQAVNKADTTTSIISSTNPSVYGQAVTFTATVNPVAPGAGTRTGTITFKEGITILGTGTVDASGHASFMIASLSVNSHSIVAEYSGDGSFNDSASSPLNQVVNKRATMTTLAITPSSIQEGQNSVVVVTVADTDVLPKFSPIGTIVLSSSVPSKAVFNGACSLLPTVTPGVSQCTVTLTGLDDGPQTITSDFPASSIHLMSSNSKILTVTNALPVIPSITGPTGPLAITGATVNITANFTDFGSLDTHLCTFAWDDLTPTMPVTPTGTGNGSCTAAHTYTATGVYAVRVTVTDDDGGSVESIFEYVVVYDPNGGFVTGGGFINSPAGAYAANPSLTGKANFGFVSKFLKGATKPTGETEFQFQVGNIDFHSSAYDWLVISGARAQYKGTGTINNSGNFGFLLTATDGQLSGGGGVDKFRIKIWDKASSQVIYDNVPTASDDVDTANPQALAGGSVVIHK